MQIWCGQKLKYLILRSRLLSRGIFKGCVRWSTPWGGLGHPEITRGSLIPTLWVSHRSFVGGETCLRRAAGPVPTAPASEKRAGAARVHLGAGLLKYRHGERRGSSACAVAQLAEWQPSAAQLPLAVAQLSFL